MATNSLEWREKNKDKLRAYRKKWNEKNKDKVRASKKKHSFKNSGRMKQYIELKKTLCCSRCDESHYACLDFHHEDPATKSFCIGNMAGKVSHEELLSEAAKCIVLCANCHRKEHANG